MSGGDGGVRGGGGVEVAGLTTIETALTRTGREA